MKKCMLILLNFYAVHAIRHFCPLLNWTDMKVITGKQECLNVRNVIRRSLTNRDWNDTRLYMQKKSLINVIIAMRVLLLMEN
uniref:Putative secreted protein n=1 Tax=Xenopsylla cheopis TaxID=163159 RepID=A0A6M2DW48_XENCH